MKSSQKPGRKMLFPIEAMSGQHDCPKCGASVGCIYEMVFEKNAGRWFCGKCVEERMTAIRNGELDAEELRRSAAKSTAEFFGSMKNVF